MIPPRSISKPLRAASKTIVHLFAAWHAELLFLSRTKLFHPQKQLVETLRTSQQVTASPTVCRLNSNGGLDQRYYLNCLTVVSFFLTPAAFPGYEPDVIEEKKRESCIGPFKIAPVKAECAVNNDTGNNCELNYRKGLFHVCSKRKARFWRAVKKYLPGSGSDPLKRFLCVQR